MYAKVNFEHLCLNIIDKYGIIKMNGDDADDLINNLISLSNGQIDLETFKQILIPNYIDNNGNSYFHFLTEYSFKEFCLRNFKLKKDKNIVSFEKYNEIKKEYNQ